MCAVIIRLFIQNLLASPPAEPLSVHQEVQQVEATVAEGKESLGQGQGSSDSDDCLTSSPPPTKRVKVQSHQNVVQNAFKECVTLILFQMKLQEDESEQSTSESKATEDSEFFNGAK